MASWQTDGPQSHRGTEKKTDSEIFSSVPLWHLTPAVKSPAPCSVMGIEVRMSTCETDMSLLRRYAEARDPAAFAEITRRYAGVVFAACHRVLSDAARAEDVSQETFFRLMRRPEAVSQSLGA